MAQLEGKDVIAAKEGSAYVTANGKNTVLFYAKSVNAKIKKDKKEIKALGSRMTKHKTVGASGEGTLKIYEVTSEFKKMIHEYIKNGKDIYFNIIVTNNDPTTEYGSEVKALYGCNIDEVDVVNLDAEGEFLEQEMSFTFDDFELLSEFNEVKNN